MARMLTSYIPWFREQTREIIPEIRHLQKVLSRKFTKKLLMTLQGEGLAVEDKKGVQTLLEESIEWLKWLRETHSWLISKRR